MIQQKRNIHIRLRGKNYIYLKGMARKLNLTTTDLIREISLAEIESQDQINDHIERTKHAVFELKKISDLFNLLTKQINSNIINRTYLTEEICQGIRSVATQTMNELLALRNCSFFLLKKSLKVDQSSGLKYQNSKKLKEQRWHFPKIWYYESDFNKVKNWAEQQGISINKLIVERILVFQNQSTFQNATVANLARSVYKILTGLLNNSNQILRNKKGHAIASEVTLASSLKSVFPEHIDDILEDPLLHKGKKFSIMHYHRVASL
jgi:hypothetical protein